MLRLIAMSLILPFLGQMQFALFFCSSNFGFACSHRSTKNLMNFLWGHFRDLRHLALASCVAASQIIDHHSPRQSIRLLQISLMAFYRHMVCAVPLNGIKTRKSSSSRLDSLFLFYYFSARFAALKGNKSYSFIKSTECCTAARFNSGHFAGGMLELIKLSVRGPFFGMLRGI